MQKPLEKKLDPKNNLISWMTALGAGSILGTSALALNGSQLASTALLPFSRKTFRRYNRWVADTWWGWCVEMGRTLYGIEVEYSGDEIPPRENALVFSNHQQMTDTTFLMFFGKDKGRLGDMKYFAKAPIKWVPIVGWGLQFIDSIFVKREWTKDVDSIRDTFNRITSEEVPLWLVTFSEGTRITKEKHERSMAFARERNLKETKHVLLPRTKGFVASIEGLRGHIAAVYDVTIGYPEGIPSLMQYMRGMARKAHLHIRRFPIETLPEGEEALSEWIRDRFYEKDELLERYLSTGSFEA